MSTAGPERRVVVVGSGGFLGGAIVERLGMAGVRRSHQDPVRLDAETGALVLAGRPSGINERDLVTADFADYDWLREAARHATPVILLSSQAVYGRTGRLSEDLDATPGTTYGRNVLRREEIARALVGDKLTALRIGNVVGFDVDTSRRTFMSQMLTSLRDKRRITLDVSPFDARDFLPVRRIADAVARVANVPPQRILNVGSGTATAVGQLALAAIRGFGSGDLLITGTDVRQPFVLEIGHLQALGEPPCSTDDILAAMNAAGQRLRS